MPAHLVFIGGRGGEPRARGKTHRLMASRNMLCSRSVHDSRLLVIVYGLRVFDASGFFMVDGRGRSQTNASRETTNQRARAVSPVSGSALASAEARNASTRPSPRSLPPRTPRVRLARACDRRSRVLARAVFASSSVRPSRRRVRIRANGRARERNRATLSLAAARGGGLETDARLSGVRSRVVQLCRRPDAA